MRARLQITLLTILLAGCATSHPTPSPSAAPIVAPSTAMVATRQKSLNAYQVLAGPENPDFFIGREEKFAYGAVFIGGSSAFTTYTYDAQSISTPAGFGYRYRWVVQDGVSAPLAP